jgi:hypothetical protein
VLSTPVTTDYGQTATVTATVTPTATPPSGYPAESTSVNTVQFTVNGVNFGSPEALNASDQAVFSDAALPAGNSTIGAIYNHAGTDANYATSTATSVTQVVNLARSHRRSPRRLHHRSWRRTGVSPSPTRQR